MATRLLERHLEELSVLPAASLEQAAALVREQHPAAAFILAEPGAQALDAALAQGEGLLGAVAPFDLTVAVCTLPTERGASLALGVDELLVKPVTRAEVLAAMKRLCPMPTKVLIVDDDADMLRLLARLVKKEWPRAEILQATSGEAAIALLPRQPNLMLLDLLMPGITGSEVLAAMRANPRTAGTSVVVITGRGPAQELQPSGRGAVHVLRRSSLSAGETVRLLSLLARALPPRYAVERIGLEAGASNS